jgi:site-specific DNA recombinase
MKLKPETFYLKTVEAAVLTGLDREMRHPDVIAEYVRTYQEERRRLTAEANIKRVRLERRIDELNREIDRLVDAIAKGHGDAAVLGPRVTALHEEHSQITAELEGEPPTANVVSLHPSILARFEQQLHHLQDALSQGLRGGDDEGSEAIRDLVETVTVFRDPSRRGGVEVRDRRTVECASWRDRLSQRGQRSCGEIW